MFDKENVISVVNAFITSVAILLIMVVVDAFISGVRDAASMPHTPEAYYTEL